MLGALAGKESEKPKYKGAKKSKRPMREQDDTEEDNCVIFTIYAMNHNIIDQAIRRLLAELDRIVFTKKFNDTVLVKLDQNQVSRIIVALIIFLTFPIKKVVSNFC